MVIHHDELYQVEYSFVSDANTFSLISILYQPLLGSDAYRLYLFFLEQGNSWTKYSYRMLSNVLNISIPNIEEALIKLQQYQLIRIFEKEEFDRNSIYFY